MSRPLVAVVLVYIVGILLSSYLTYAISVAFIGVAFLFVLALVAYLRDWRIGFYIILILFIALGGALGKIAVDKSETPLADYAGHYVTVIGTVIQDPDVRPDKVYLVVKCQELHTGVEDRKVSGLVRVRVAVESEQIISSAEGSDSKKGDHGFVGSGGSAFSYGSMIKVNGLLNVPDPPGNPGAFDYKTYLLRQGIRVELYAREFTPLHSSDGSVGGHSDKFIAPDLNPITAAALGFKGALTAIIDNSLSSENAALLKGIMLGERGMIDRETLDTFVDVGTIHLLCVSGFHVGLVMAVMLLLCRSLRLNSKKTLFLTVPVLILYATMTGLTPSVMRATIMATTFLVAHALDRNRDWPTTLAIAALIILVFNPLALFTPGFQMSFGATWGILYLIPIFSNLFRSWPSWLAAPFTVTLAAQLGVLPLVAAHYNIVSLISLVANLIAIPLVTLIMHLGILATLAGLALGQATAYAAPAIEALLDLLVYSGGLLGRLPGAVVNVRTPPILTIVLWYAILFGLGKFLAHQDFRNIVKARFYRFYIDRKKLRYFLLAVALVICLAVAFFWGGSQDDLLLVHFIDVGQGDSALLEFPRGKTMLIDTGGKMGELESKTGVGDMVVLPYLKRQGVNKIDLLVLTHPHEDHVSGAWAVCKDMKVGMVIVPAGGDGDDGDISYQRLLQEIKSRGIPVKVAGKGDLINLDERVHCEILWPPRSVEKTPRIILDNWNNRSLVLRCQYDQVSLLFTGDIERDSQEILLRSQENTEVSVLKVPHHGSANFSPDFIKNLHPRAAVVSVGAGNRFGHPSQDVMQVLEELNVKIFRTDEDGAVLMRTDGKDLRITTGRGQ